MRLVAGDDCWIGQTTVNTNVWRWHFRDRWIGRCDRRLPEESSFFGHINTRTKLVGSSSVRFSIVGSGSGWFDWKKCERVYLLGVNKGL